MVVNKKTKKVFVLLLTFILFILSIWGDMARSEMVKATSSDLKIDWIDEAEYYDFDNVLNYVRVQLLNMKKEAKYHVDISDETVADFTGCFESKLYFLVKKEGSFRVTIQETYKNKTKKIETKLITVNSKKNDEEKLKYAHVSMRDVVIMEKGMTVSTKLLADISCDVDVSVGNSDIIVVEDGKYLTAKKEGSTYLQFDYEGAEYDEDTEERVFCHETVKGKIIVVEADTTEQSKKRTKKGNLINQYCTTKITAQNAVSILKKINSLNLKEDTEFGDFVDVIGKYGEEDYEKWVHQIVIPSKNTQLDLQRVREKCGLAAGLNLFEGDVVLEVDKIKKLTPKKITLNLKHAVTEAEAAMMKNKDYFINLEDVIGCSYVFKGKLKKGKTTLTGTLYKGEPNPRVGKTYYFTTSSKNTIKSVKIKCSK